MTRLRIKAVAKARGFTISSLARRADVNYRTVQRLWNEPGCDVGLKTLEKVASALGVSVKALIENGEDTEMGQWGARGQVGATP